MSNDVLSSLRTKLDGQDGFLSGHRVVKTTGATQHDARMKRVPVWANDDAKIKELVEKHFPKMKTDPSQRTQAGRLIRLIYLYYRVGATARVVADELKISVPMVKKIVHRLKIQMGKEVKVANRPKKGVSIQTSFGNCGDDGHISL